MRVYTPAQNGGFECKNMHLLKVAHALMFKQKFPNLFKPNALSTAYILIIQMPSNVLDGNIPFTTLFPSKQLFPLNLQYLVALVLFRMFGPKLPN